jgi:CubicO group peptidase (beta-lactamase class C family)
MNLKLASLAAAVTLLTGLAANAAEKPVPENLQQLEQALVEILEETGLPGLGIAIVSRDAILWTAGLGLADVERQIPATADTLFRIGSTAKAFVALAAGRALLVLQLRSADRGLRDRENHGPAIRGLRAAAPV